MFCNNCGQQIADGATFCPNCGTATAPQPQQNQQQYQQAPPQGQQAPPQYQQVPPQGQQKSAFDQVMDTPDYTGSFHPQEIQNGKAMSILCYFGLLVLIPLLAEKNNRYVRFHVNQGLILFICSLIGSVANVIFAYIPVLGVILRLVIWLAIFALFIFGLVNAGSGKAKELPLIGKFKLVS